MTERLDSSQWGRYWQKGSITTFLGRFADNYDGPVREFWQGVFDGLPTDANVVDLGTGNGAVALLAAQYSHRRHKEFRVVGVDSAPIDPVRRFAGKGYARHLRRIRFLPKTPIEAIPLPAASQHLAMSQFGFEYADADKAVAELDRVLKKRGARFAAMLHHADSAIVQQAKEGIEQVAACAKSGLHPAIEELHARLDKLAKMGRDPRGDRRAAAGRTAVNDTLARLKRAGERYGDPGQLVYYVEQSMATFNPTASRGMDLDGKLAALRAVAQETESYRQRMRDLISAALDDAEVSRLTKRLGRAGFVLESDRPFALADIHFCHELQAAR